MRQTFDLVTAAMARGYGNSGVASAVKNVLLPFLRALEEQMDTFQKSASATLPKLAAVWAKVVAVAPTKAWLLSAESSFSTDSSNSEKIELQTLTEGGADGTRGAQEGAGDAQTAVQTSQ